MTYLSLPKFHKHDLVHLKAQVGGIRLIEGFVERTDGNRALITISELSRGGTEYQFALGDITELILHVPNYRCPECKCNRAHTPKEHKVECSRKHDRAEEANK